MVILLSTRGTAGSVNWFMCLADRPMVRGHHLRDKDWTPLSPNPVQICNDIVGVLVLRGNNILSFPLRWLSHSKRLKSSVIAGGLVVWYSHFERENTKSSVDDLAFGRGVVPSRAAFILRSIETHPIDGEICLPLTDIFPTSCDGVRWCTCVMRCGERCLIMID